MHVRSSLVRGSRTWQRVQSILSSIRTIQGNSDFHFGWNLRVRVCLELLEVLASLDDGV